MSGRDGFSRTQSANSEQSVLSCYNEAVKYHKAGLLDDAENKFRQALLKHKRHVRSSTFPLSLCPHAPTPAFCVVWVSGRLMAIPVDVYAVVAPQVPSIVGLGSLLREMGRGEEGKKLLQEASGMISAGVREMPACTLINAIPSDLIAQSLFPCRTQLHLSPWPTARQRWESPRGQARYRSIHLCSIPRLRR